MNLQEYCHIYIHKKQGNLIDGQDVKNIVVLLGTRERFSV
jgi:hypothetical protein